jgi:transcriptional regulator with XRE-family HTH domain
VQVSSGVPTLDSFLAGGLAEGDNIVWVADDVEDLAVVVERFLSVDPSAASLVEPRAVLGGQRRRGVPQGDVGFPTPEQLSAMLLAPHVTTGSRVAVVSLDDLVIRWGAEEAVEFYVRTCPQLFDRGAVAYWVASRDVIGHSSLERISRVAQCVFELRAGRLRIRKAEGRPARVQGAVADFSAGDGVPVVSREHSVGRLGEGLRRLRADRGWSQTQLARVAGVSPAAISQAESGRRGLSLDTLVPLCESLGVGLDELLGIGRPPSPWLARRDRASGPVVPLFDEPAAGARVHLVRLGVGESGRPPLPHKGPEMVLAATGLVLIDLGEFTPVLRAGDGALVPDVAVQGWTNLGPEPATLFWLALPAAAG